MNLVKMFKGSGRKKLEMGNGHYYKSFIVLDFGSLYYNYQIKSSHFSTCLQGVVASIFLYKIVKLISVAMMKTTKFIYLITQSLTIHTYFNILEW